MVNAAQVILLVLAILAYLAGGAISLLAVAGRKTPPHWRWTLMAGGFAFSLTLLIWHSVLVGGTWQPLQDSLSALLTLSLLLAGFVAYVQLRRPIASLEWLVMPVVVVLLLMAGHFGTTRSATYLPTAYSLVHRLFTYLGALAFVVAGATGALYLMSDRMLRARPARAGAGGHLPPSPGLFGSLERLEHLAFSAVTWGFALFTVGIISGVAWVVHEHGKTKLGEVWYLSPKVVLTMAVWVVFAIVLNTPIAPRLRGRKNAILSIVGLILTLATLFAVLLMPAGGEP